MGGLRMSDRRRACIAVLALSLVMGAAGSGGVNARQVAPAGEVITTSTNVLDMAEVLPSQAACFFSEDCTLVSDNLTSGFTFVDTTGSGFLRSGAAPLGEPGTAGAGLRPYIYLVDLGDLEASAKQACVSRLALDVGPIVPLDYDDDSNLEHLFLITDGSPGSLAPSMADATDGLLTLHFSPPVCSGSPKEDGQTSLAIGLASPFRYREATADLDVNLEPNGVKLDARIPDYVTDPTLSVVPSSDYAGQGVRLIGTGYEPGGYEGTVLWDGSADGIFDIPVGGAFGIDYVIPTDTTLGDHTITTCSGHPCASGTFEQRASAPFAVTAADPGAAAHLVYLPIVWRDVSHGSPEPFSYAVNANVVPFQAELPGLHADAPPRPLGAVRSPEGYVTTFVRNELVVQSDDDKAVSRLLDRVNGEIILTIDPMHAGVKDLAKIYLVAADLNMADTSGLAADVEALMPDEIKSAGEFLFSDGDGPRIFALAASEAREKGTSVGVNWVSETATVTGWPHDSKEAPDGRTWGGIDYDPDAYTWTYMARGTRQDIGVPEAWNLLYHAGRLTNKVQIAVLDGGFYPNSDFPSGVTYASVMPFVIDPRNVRGLDSKARYHGTDVLQTLAARSDNDAGIVGVAAPVVDPIAVYTAYDFFTSISAVLAARAHGADVINMSYSAAVPSIFGWTVFPFEATTAMLRASGVLLFASAGNAGDSVDAKRCFLGICWEHTWHTPCENNGVICVGGLAWDERGRASASNYGSEHVDIFAPFTVYRGQSPDLPNGDTRVEIISGTSFSSPYAASVAGLIWAGNPSLSASEVWHIMRQTAHTSPDGRVKRYVNAFDAVLQAVGVGVDATISGPPDGGTYDLNQGVAMYGRVTYVASGPDTPVRVQWFDDSAARLLYDVTRSPGAGAHTFYADTTHSDFAEGTHTLRLRATAGDAVAQDTTRITIENSPPVASIDQPSDGREFCPGEIITFRGSAFDANESGGLPSSAFVWRSDQDGHLNTADSFSCSSLSEGGHTITLRVTDPQGASDEDMIGLTILPASDPACADLHPHAFIVSPEHDTSIAATEYDEEQERRYATVDFEGLVSDAEDDVADLAVAWTSDLQGSLGTPAVDPTTGRTTISARIYARSAGTVSTPHTITLRVEDSAGNVTEDQITIHIIVLI